MRMMAIKDLQAGAPLLPARAGVLRRKCDCGQHTIAGGSCVACSKQRAMADHHSPITALHANGRIGSPMDDTDRSSVHPRSGALSSVRLDDFSRVRTDSSLPPGQLSSFGAVTATKMQGSHQGVFVDGNDTGATGNQASPNPPLPTQPPPGRQAATCPTDIRVVSVGQGNDVEFGRTGPMTGWGGFARMEVSDPTGRNWNGTAIHETLRRVTNTCGAEGNNACSNVSGEGGSRGSAFEVGTGSNFLGLAELPPVTNRFYDVHAFFRRGSSLLHRLERPTCEVQCEQFFDCGGTRFGPRFVITYAMTRESVPRRDGAFNGVTRVAIRKNETTASPTTRSGGPTP